MLSIKNHFHAADAFVNLCLQLTLQNEFTLITMKHDRQFDQQLTQHSVIIIKMLSTKYHFHLIHCNHVIIILH